MTSSSLTTRNSHTRNSLTWWKLPVLALVLVVGTHLAVATFVVHTTTLCASLHWFLACGISS
jgi:hypothetical protein